MEYKDYRTDEIISRKQYIKNGLERGELLVKRECGCVVIQDRTTDAYIVYCPKHESAPDLYEALKVILDAEERGKHTELTEYEKVLAQEAITKAEGK